MSILIVIPARYDSSRFPGKPLVNLKGVTGQAKPLIKRTWEAAMKVKDVDKVVVATDDLRISKVVKEFGGEVLLTSPDWRNGTERCSEASEYFANKYDLVVNLQGDAPLTPNWFIEALINTFRNASDQNILTPALRCNSSEIAALKADRQANRVGGTTVVFGTKKQALYFSKEVIPWYDRSADSTPPVYLHVGVYAYTPKALSWYAKKPPGQLEQNEGLEQLRFLEYGKAIHCVEVNSKGRPMWELNNPSDIEIIERYLKQAKIE